MARDHTGICIYFLPLFAKCKSLKVWEPLTSATCQTLGLEVVISVMSDILSWPEPEVIVCCAYPNSQMTWQGQHWSQHLQKPGLLTLSIPLSSAPACPTRLSPTQQRPLQQQPHFMLRWGSLYILLFLIVVCLFFQFLDGFYTSLVILFFQFLLNLGSNMNNALIYGRQCSLTN